MEAKNVTSTHKRKHSNLSENRKSKKFCENKPTTNSIISNDAIHIPEGTCTNTNGKHSHKVLSVIHTTCAITNCEDSHKALSVTQGTSGNTNGECSDNPVCQPENAGTTGLPFHIFAKYS